MLTLDKLLLFKIKNEETGGAIEQISMKVKSVENDPKACELEIGFDDKLYSFEGILKKNIVQIRPYNIEKEHKQEIDALCEEKNCKKIGEILKLNSQVRAMLMFQNDKLLNMSSFYIKCKGEDEWERFTLEMVENSTKITQDI